jgi:hypothetical protein
MGRGAYTGGGSVIRITEDGTQYEGSPDSADISTEIQRRKPRPIRNREQLEKALEENAKAYRNAKLAIEYAFLAACAHAALSGQLSATHPAPPPNLTKQVAICGGNLRWVARDLLRMKRFKKVMLGQGWQPSDD